MDGALLSLGQSARTLLHRRESDALVGRQADQRSLLTADDEDVAESGGERVADRIFDVDDFERARVTFSRDDRTDSAHRVTAGHQAQLADLELGEVDDLVRAEVVLDRVVRLDQRVRIADGATVVGDYVWNLVRTDRGALHTAQLVARLLRRDLVQDEATLHIVENAEVLAGALDVHNVCVAEREGRERRLAECDLALFNNWVMLANMDNSI